MQELSAAEPAAPGPLSPRAESCEGDVDEASLVRAAQGGSTDASAELVKRHWAEAHRAAYLLVRDRHAAEDIAQEAMLAAIGAIHDFDRRRSFRPWLHRIVVNRSLDWLRANERWREIPVAEAPGPAEDAQPDRDGLSAPMIDALATLAPEQRAALVLRYLLGYRSREIARMLDTRPATVRTRLRRALAELRAAYETGMEEEERDAGIKAE